LAGGLSDFVSAASWLLPDGGRFYVVYLAERADELLACMRQAKLGPKRLRCVHGRRDEAARMVLVEGRKNGGAGLTIEPPLVVWEGDGYTREVLRIYDEDFSED
jgi:tRNA1Val (adenine37-N6)-methyltransferase